MLKTCPVCGRNFEAQRSTAKYCSSKCRVRAFRGTQPVKPELPLCIPKRSGDVTEDMALLVLEARQVGSAFIQQQNAVPLPLRAGCERVGKSILDALDGEGW